MILNGASVTTTDTDGLVDAETLSSAGNFTIDGNQSSLASSGLNSFITIASSNNLSSVTFTITGTDIDGVSQTEAVTGPTANGSITSTKIFKTFRKSLFTLRRNV